MIPGFVLISCEAKKGISVKKKLATLREVKKVDYLAGLYDVIVTINADSIDSFRNIVTKKIRKIEGIQSTMSLIGKQ